MEKYQLFKKEIHEKFEEFVVKKWNNFDILPV